MRGEIAQGRARTEGHVSSIPISSHCPSSWKIAMLSSIDVDYGYPKL